jgi:hypothetical protein
MLINYSKQSIENSSLDWCLEQVRNKRNKLLAECDWVMMPDCPIVNKSKWELYRQQLRDITNNIHGIQDIIDNNFPNKPE